MLKAERSWIFIFIISSFFYDGGVICLAFILVTKHLPLDQASYIASYKKSIFYFVRIDPKIGYNTQKSRSKAEWENLSYN